MLSSLLKRVPLAVVALSAAVLASIALPGMAAASSTWTANVYSAGGVRWQDPDYHACAAAATLMMLNFTQASPGATVPAWHATTSYHVQEDILAYSRAHMTMPTKGTGGTDPVGWRNALNYYGWGSVNAGVYTIETATSFLGAAKASVEALARTDEPVAIAGWSGTHAQIMNGYKVTGGDPRVSSDFTIVGVYVTDPLRSDGYRNTYISLSTWQKGDPHIRFQQYSQTDSPYRDPLTGTIGKDVWVGKWLIIAPVSAPAAPSVTPSPNPAPSPTSHAVTRLAGPTRFATAAAISKATFSPGVPVAYVAYAYNFPDALAAAAAAGTRKGPVLYVNTSGPIDAATAAELTRLKPATIDVLGGTGVISDAVKAALGPYATSHAVTRLAGPTRFATAAAISKATFSPGVPVAYVAYAYNFPDALAAAAAAGTRKGPVLYVNTSGPIDAATAAELTRLKPATIDVLGGTGVISDAVKAALGPYATSHAVTRLAGPTRFATAAAISKATFSPGVPVAYVAYAYNFPDALAAAAAAGTRKGPVLYVNTSGPIDAATAAELTRLKPATIDVLGGTGVISDAVKAALGPYATSP